MQGPLAGDEKAAAAPSDRWSLAVSSLLILGLIVAAAAMVQNWRTTPPDTPKITLPVATLSKPKAATPDAAAQALAIRLPPPPPPAARPAEPTVKARPPQPTAKPRMVEPLKRAAEATRPQPRSRPIKPIKVIPLKPVPLARRAARMTPKKVAAIKPAPKRTSEPTPAQPVIDATQHRKTGGTLLRHLEHGKGPSIEIAWPGSASDRQRLFKTLTRCYGMRPALLTQGTQLFDASSAPGRPWAISRDRYSGFIRSPRGEPIGAENRQFAAIASRHGLTDWRPVRVFPRAVDAVLLGGLGTLLGEGYQAARQIRAIYRLHPNGLGLTGFRVDGRAVAGVILLPASLSHGCD